MGTLLYLCCLDNIAHVLSSRFDPIDSGVLENGTLSLLPAAIKESEEVEEKGPIS